jgi:CRISPR-associated endonuclease/helicase Cas3
MEGLQGSGEYSQWFEQATGRSPYRYQQALAEAETPPSVLAVPTGCGKTQAVLGSWVYQRQWGIGPRRLVYALPMRTLVEQTQGVALAMRERLGLAPEALPIHSLMGGEDLRANDWRRQPEADQILIGTIDMLLSRALNRGYGESRFSWPISFGLLNSDCRWVFDEVQLMGPARTTSAQLDGLRAALGTALACESIWVSATVEPEDLRTVDRPDAGEVMSLPDADRKGGLRKRLTAAKTLERVDLAAAEPGSLPRSIAELARKRHQRGTLTLVVLNRVETAQAVFAELRKRGGEEETPETVLLHSRFRPPDRAAHMEEAFAAPGAAGRIVVSTQVIEAGVDLSARTLLTETAPFSSIVQRLGRCNREGEHPGEVVWLDLGEVDDTAAGGKAAAPYLSQELNTARQVLLDLEGESLSPQRVERIEVADVADDPATLRRRDLIDLFDISPDLSGLDVDVAPFIREDDERTVLACFREIDAERRLPVSADLPGRDEIVQVPRASLGRRRCWKADHVDGSWEPRPASEIPPGSTVVLDARDGGYTPELGWAPASKAPMETVAPSPDSGSPEGFGYNDLGGSPQELLEHLELARVAAADLADRLELTRWADALVAAAALHDLGKAHPAFQAMLRDAMGPAGDGEERLWAKSGRRGGRRERPFLRHELVGALALRALNGEVELGERDLVTYLIAAHHGRVRLSIRTAPGEILPGDAGTRSDNSPRFALGIVDGEPLPAVETPLGSLPATTLSLRCMELGAEDSWTDAAVALRDSPELGPFRLAFLEAILRIADWRASA